MAEPPLFFLDGFLEGFVIPFWMYFGGCWRSNTRFGCRLYKKLNPHGGMTFQACIFLFKNGLDAFVFRTCFLLSFLSEKALKMSPFLAALFCKLGSPPSVGGLSKNNSQTALRRWETSQIVPKRGLGAFLAPRGSIWMVWVINLCATVGVACVWNRSEHEKHQKHQHGSPIVF